LTIIDGYNVILGARADRFDSYAPGELEKMRSTFLDRLADSRAARRDEITVVFDGGARGALYAREQTCRGIRVIFSDPNSDADAEIKKLVRTSSGARDLRVVTDDNQLARQVSQLRAKVVSCVEFLGDLQKLEDRDARREQGRDPSFRFEPPRAFEVDDWVKAFGGEPAEGEPEEDDDDEEEEDGEDGDER